MQSFHFISGFDTDVLFWYFVLFFYAVPWRSDFVYAYRIITNNSQNMLAAL